MRRLMPLGLYVSARCLEFVTWLLVPGVARICEVECKAPAALLLILSSPNVGLRIRPATPRSA